MKKMCVGMMLLVSVLAGGCKDKQKAYVGIQSIFNDGRVYSRLECRILNDNQFLVVTSNKLFVISEDGSGSFSYYLSNKTNYLDLVYEIDLKKCTPLSDGIRLVNSRGAR